MIAPKKCYSCKKEWHFLCEECYKKFPLHTPYCYVCKKRSYAWEVHELCKEDIYYDNILVLFHYKETLIKKMIHDFKFYKRKDISEDFWWYLASFFSEYFKNSDNYIFVYPPIRFLKKMKRGYNQSQLLWKKVSHIIWIPMLDDVIQLKKSKRQQSKLTKEQRRQNIINSFQINKKYVDIIDKKKVIIIDDVISTGSTVNEIAKVLKESWVKEVLWLIVASE